MFSFSACLVLVKVPSLFGDHVSGKEQVHQESTQGGSKPGHHEETAGSHQDSYASKNTTKC